MALGVNPLWLGIFYQFMGEIALLTPPVGLNLFIMTQMSGIPLARVIKGNIPFVGFMSLTLLILYLFPGLVTWLPSIMMK
jgi:TRAP-type C4-dicarboxylate transport system permease large subunit